MNQPITLTKPSTIQVLSVSQTGRYRLRTATVDTVGRTTVRRLDFEVDSPLGDGGQWLARSG
ncbi:MAG: hypothetical protein ACFHW5_07725 [Verrucomicrobiota bacterium]